MKASPSGSWTGRLVLFCGKTRESEGFPETKRKHSMLAGARRNAKRKLL
jgi:hypothetical protein